MEISNFDSYEFQKDLIGLLLSGFMESKDGIVYLDAEIVKRTGSVSHSPENILPQLSRLEELKLIKTLNRSSGTIENGISVKINFVRLNDYLHNELNDDYGQSLADSKLVTATLALEGNSLFITSDYGEQRFKLTTFKRKDAGGLYLMRYVLGSGSDQVSTIDFQEQLDYLDKHKNLKDVIRKSELKLLEGIFILSARKESVVIKKKVDMSYGEFIKLINSFA
jgi:hypothetical protein